MRHDPPALRASGHLASNRLGVRSMKLRGYDDKAYVLINEMMEYAENWLVRSDVCPAECAAEHLALDYIATVSSVIKYGNQYLEAEETAGADLFLSRIVSAQTKTRFQRNARRCAVHLATDPSRHFPNYAGQLRLALLHVLRTTDDAHALRSNGVTLLASGSLEGVKIDIQRELRRRGLTYEPTLVADATVSRRTKAARASRALTNESPTTPL